MIFGGGSGGLWDSGLKCFGFVGRGGSTLKTMCSGFRLNPALSLSIKRLPHLLNFRNFPMGDRGEEIFWHSQFQQKTSHDRRFSGLIWDRTSYRCGGRICEPARLQNPYDAVIPKPYTPTVSTDIAESGTPSPTAQELKRPATCPNCQHHAVACIIPPLEFRAWFSEVSPCEDCNTMALSILDHLRVPLKL